MSEERGEGDGGLRGAEEGQQVAVGEAEEEVGHLHVAEEKCAAGEGGRGELLRQTHVLHAVDHQADAERLLGILGLVGELQ